MTALPVLNIGVCFLSTVWPRWRASGARRVAHLGQVSAGQAFTPAEAVVVVIGATLAAIACLWGLLLVAAPPWWWVVFMAAFAAALVVYLVFRQGRQLWRRAWSQSVPTP